MKESARDKFTQINSILGQRGQLGLREGGEGRGYVSLHSLKTVTSNKYQASEGGRLGRKGNFCEKLI